jgi:nicotinamide mononucleotide transporter
MIEFLIGNWVEIAGTLFAIVYLFFSIRQNIWLWLCGILTSLFYIYVFAKEAFYADMGLQFYYLFISIYGWIIWAHGGVNHNKSKMPVIRLPKRMLLRLIVVHTFIYAVILAMLLFLPDRLGVQSSSLPYLDALTTSAGIVATWMIAKKYLENWIVWIVVDFISMCMYVYKGLTITAVLFVIYTIAAIIGYRTWLKSENDKMLIV